MSDKIMSKKCCGIRLNSRRFSVHRLRTNFLHLCRIFRRWRNSYRNSMILLKRKLVICRRRGRNNRTDYSADGNNLEFGYGNRYGYSSTSFSAVRTMAHSNSFCSEAIADCLEFIKRNSVSIDDDRNPMLVQD